MDVLSQVDVQIPQKYVQDAENLLKSISPKSSENLDAG